MSGAITATSQSDSGWMSGLISDASNVRAQEQTLNSQVSTGLVSTTYSGLGSGAAVSLDINPEIANLQTWQSNINQAAGSMHGYDRRRGASRLAAGRWAARYDRREYLRIRRR